MAFKARKIQKYGWVPDRPDVRDMRLAAPPAHLVETYPPSYNLQSMFPSIYQQANLGSCVGNGCAGLGEYLLIKLKKKVFVPSRLFIYYNSRYLEGTVSQDAGAQIRDGMKSIATKGLPPEAMWPYDISKFADKAPPSAYQAGKKHLVSQYFRIDNTNLNVIKHSLVNGFPIVFGCTVYDSFESQAVAASGNVPLPSPGEDVVGGHCMVIAGYDDNWKIFVVRNSWGTDWGKLGWCTMPYDYILNPNLTGDCWIAKGIIGV